MEDLTRALAVFSLALQDWLDKDDANLLAFEPMDEWAAVLRILAQRQEDKAKKGS